MERKWNLVEVDGRIVVPFDWRDPKPGGSNLGRAEFQVCLKFNGRERSSEFWVYPVQTRIDDYWHYINGDIFFALNAYQGLDDPKTWMARWCKEHKTITLSVYSPSHAKYLVIDWHGLEFWKTNPYTEATYLTSDQPAWIDN